ncbi:MAG: hypothetical protein ACP5OA_03675 [Candidatus Woesearchaeota archaeon]
MKQMIMAGLCTLLLGNIQGQDVKIAKPDKPELEIIVQKTEFIGPDGNYSFKLNANDYTISKASHEVFSNGSFVDGYYCTLDLITLVKNGVKHKPDWTLMIQGTKSVDEINLIYDMIVANYLKGMMDIISDQSKKGITLRMNTSKIESQNMTIDNAPAIRNRVEFWLSKDPEYYSDQKPIDKTKGVYLQTIIAGKNGLYGIVLFHKPFDDAENVKADTFYNEILKSFDALK